MPVLQKEQITEKIVPVFEQACSDKVPNVQFCVCMILMQNKHLIDPSVFSAKLVPKLRDLINDGDRDVSYYANAAFNE